MKLKCNLINFADLGNKALISLTTDDNLYIKELQEDLKKQVEQGKEWLSVEIKAYKSKRSVEQNKLMWEMLTLLSEKVNNKKDSQMVWEMYCEMLLRFGQEPFYLEGLPETNKELQEHFRAVRVIEKRQSNGKETYMYQCFHGSSKYNTKQMTEFINSIQEELRELGVNYEL